MTTLRRALVFSFLESYLGIALNLVSFIVLARLLTPAQVGLFSVALAIISVTQVIRDFGLVSFLIQKKDLTVDHISTAWALALILGGSLFVAVELAAPFIGAFYNDPSLTNIARIVAINFMILPLNSVCLALLRREMNFQTVMRLNLAGAFLSTLATIGMAWAGMGAYALAIGSVLNNAIVAAGLLLVGAASRLVWPTLRTWREILKFGGPVTFANVITSITMDVNDLVVGKLMGFQAVAIVSRAQGLMNLFHRDFMNAVRNVAYPAFSKSHRNQEDVDGKFIASVINVTAIAWTFYGFAALFPLEVLRLMFGPQWDMSAPLVPLFCIAGAASALVSLIPTAMLATGNSTQVATGELMIQPIRAATLCAIIFYYRDLQLFAAGYMGVMLFSVPYWFTIKQRCLPTRFRELGRGLARNLALTLISLAPAAVVIAFQRPTGAALPYPLFFGCALATCLAWGLSLWAFRHPLFLELLSILAARRQPRALTKQP